MGSISYDPNGNLKTLQRSRDTGSLIDNLTYQYVSGKNRLNYVDDAIGTSAETWDVEDGASGAFTYDASGNMTKAQAPYGLTSLTYDERNLPLAITTGGVTTNYRYSASGQRYWKKTGTNAGEYYALDGAVTVGVFSDAGALKHWNILAGGAVVGRYESGAKRYYHRDHLGTTRVVVDASGTVKEARDYYPFGLAMPGRTYQNGTGAREGFTGKERDAETGLDYFGARYYMAALGRWGNVDPLAEKYAGWSPYNYVLNNPLGLVDPDGMEADFITQATHDVWNSWGIQICDNFGSRCPQDCLHESTPIIDKVFEGDQVSRGLSYMWEKSNSGARQITSPALTGNVTREVSAFLATNAKGTPILYVINSMANTSTGSLNPKVKEDRSGMMRFLGNVIIAQIHTHPDFIQPGGSMFSAYYNASTADQDRAKEWRSVVMTMTAQTMGATTGLGTQDLNRSHKNFREAVTTGGDVKLLIETVNYYNTLIPRRGRR